MADLRTNYQDDVLDASKNTARVYDLVDSNGTVVLAGVHLEDKTVYTTKGGDYGAADINEQNGKINELSNDLTVYYDSITKKLYQRNSDGTKGDEIKMGMPSLDYANPLHTFSSTLTYTATQDCYLLGYANSPAGDNKFTTININNTQVYAVEGYHDYAADNNHTDRNQIGIIPCTKLTSGDTVVVSSAQSTLFIFAEK